SGDRFYHKLLQNVYRFLIPAESRVLEVGSGGGDLLAAVGPSRGVGVDFSSKMIEAARKRHPELEFITTEATSFKSDEKFDYIILSDLVNDASDVQRLFAHLKRNSFQHTRLVLNFYNSLWRPILTLAEKLGWKSETLSQNWLSLSDVKNLLHLAEW